MRTTLAACCLICACTAILQAHAQEPPAPLAQLPDVMITATRIPTVLDQIPAGVTVIDRETIDARGYTTLAEALSAVPGLHVVQSGGEGGNASVFIRGTESYHTLVLRDGVPVNDPSDPNDAFNFGVDTLEDVQRIEVVRGPMSGLYGSGAIGGVINIITRSGSGAPHGSVTIAGGLPRQDQVGGTLSGKSGAFDYNLDAENQSLVGSDTTPTRESVFNGALNGFRSTQGSVELGYTPVEGTRVSALLRGRESVFGLDELGFPAFDAHDYTGRDNSALGRLGATTALFGGAWESGLFLSRGVFDRNYVEELEAADPNQASGDSRYHGTRDDLQWNNTIHLPDLSWLKDAALLFGYEHIAQGARSRLDTSTDGFPYQETVDATDHSDAGHVGVQGTVLDRLTLTGDLREEAARYGGDAFTYRAGGVLAVPEIWAHLKASYGTAFRAPSLYELFGVDSSGYMGNPDLRPERSTGYEAGAIFDLPAFGRSDGVSAGATWFDNHIRDLIEFQEAPDFLSSTEVNVNRARARGVESSLTVRPARWLEATGTWTYTDAQDLETGAQLLRRPRNQLSLDASLTPYRGLRVTPEILYTSRFADYLVDDEGFQEGVGLARSGTVLNLTMTYDVRPRLRLFVDAKNIGHSRFEPASGYQIPGPSFLAGVRAGF
jgi:vitamin B12 transporter